MTTEECSPYVLFVPINDFGPLDGAAYRLTYHATLSVAVLTAIVGSSYPTGYRDQA